MLEVKRTLVKSGPELWAEVADHAAMGRHLGPFGSVRITHAEPERLVEWEGDRARGAVRLEPSGFGTRVTLTADVAAASSAPQPACPPGFWARLLRRWGAPQGAPAAVTADPPAEPALGEERVLAVLTATIDALGSARHRPFSRA